MKYTISDENRWTTLSACVEHHVFYQYTFDVWDSIGLPFNYKIKGKYPTNVIIELPIEYVEHIRGMALSMEEDLLFLEAGEDDTDENSIANQRKYMNILIDALDNPVKVFVKNK